jgi:predicted ATPase
LLGNLKSKDRNHLRVFLVPPWPEIYITDAERQHSFDAAVAEFMRLSTVYPSLGYEVVLLPKTSVQDRADLVLAMLSKQDTEA